jgi:hypothetical protein
MRPPFWVEILIVRGRDDSRVALLISVEAENYIDIREKLSLHSFTLAFVAPVATSRPDGKMPKNTLWCIA